MKRSVAVARFGLSMQGVSWAWPCSSVREGSVDSRKDFVRKSHSDYLARSKRVGAFQAISQDRHGKD